MSNQSSNERAPAPVAGSRRLGGVRLGVVAAFALVGGAIGGTGGFAIAQGTPWHGGWHNAGHRLERVQGMVLHALDSVGATSAQETKIHDIVASTFTSLTQDGSAREATRKQMLDLLRAPTIDRDALEKLRAAQVAAFDAKSKAIAAAVLEAADQLSPAQRAQLADRAEQMMARHRGMDGGRWGGHRDGGSDGQGPAEGRDDGPNKG